MKKADLANLRRDYQAKPLNKADLAKNPIDQFELWLSAAVKEELLEPNAMTLATQSNKAFPSSRTVLLKELDDESLIFYTNYNSQKSLEMEEHAKVGLNFTWLPLSRQIRILGHASKTSEERSDTYFAKRPRKSQMAAIASNQSSVLDSREALESCFNEVSKKYGEGDPIPRPTFWGGWKVKPILFEFWQGRRNRMHDRFQYQLVNGDWIIERLAP